MRERLGLIEEDERVQGQVAGHLRDAGMHVEPFESVDEFMLFRRPADYAVIVRDDESKALQLSERLRDGGEWLAVIAYAEHPTLRKVVAAMRGGVFDYFALPIDARALRRSLDLLGSGTTPYAAARQRAALARLRLDTLSPREHEVLANMAEGHSNKSIGIDLGISPRTVEIHRANMLSKLGAGTSTEALRMFYEDWLINGPASAPGA